MHSNDLLVGLPAGAFLELHCFQQYVRLRREPEHSVTRHAIAVFEVNHAPPTGRSYLDTAYRPGELYIAAVTPRPFPGAVPEAFPSQAAAATLAAPTNWLFHLRAYNSSLKSPQPVAAAAGSMIAAKSASKAGFAARGVRNSYTRT